MALVPATAARSQVQPAGANDFGGFRNVLAVGQGQTDNALDLAAFEATGSGPQSFTDQLPLYRDLVYAAPSLTARDISTYFKSAGFGAPAADVVSSETPQPGVTILRDRFNVPHVYGRTRADTEFGAGYASAEDRLFFMDVLRHLGRARLSELIGAGAGDAIVKMDADQLKIADYSEAELQRQIDVGVRSAGPEGLVLKQDLDAYAEGINTYIHRARLDPTLLPGEYAALGKLPTDWKPTDTVAIASLIGGIFGRGGGAEDRVGEALRAAQARFGPRVGQRVFSDFREREDPEAPSTIRTRFPFDNSGPVTPRAVAVPDLGSLNELNPIVSGSPVPRSSAHEPLWLARLQQRGLVFPHWQSNALLVDGRHSRSGHPLAVMGPQVGYWSPEVLMELDLHGPGIDARGATFPGISLYVLLGRGRDFAWSATSAGGDLIDQFAERLCEPNGIKPTLESTHYMYHGRCIPLLVRDHILHLTPGPLDLIDNPLARPRTITMRAERSVHGPIQARATVRGRPVAIAAARSTYFHEIDSAIAFKRLNDNEVHDARSFQRAMGLVNFTFNWFYADDRDIAYLQSGWYPRRARGVDPSLPAWGTGRWDWQHFDPATYTERRLPFARLPKAVNPYPGYMVNWNNKQAPGWRAADDNLAFGPVQRKQMLARGVRAALRAGGGKMELVGLVRAMADAATIDLRGEQVYPWLRRAFGAHVSDPDIADALRRLDAWVAEGAHRRDMNRDGVYEHSAAIALMDAWWPALLQGIYEPVLGTDLFARIRALNSFDDSPGPAGSAYDNGWYGYVQKDLRSLLGSRVRGRFSRVYCGQGSLRRCRAILGATLKHAIAEVKTRYGAANLDGVTMPTTCAEGKQPAACDQIEFTAVGAILTDPIPWQNRPTFQQVVEVQGHRPR